MINKTTKVAIILTSLFVESILLSCNPWRKGSTIKGSNAKHKTHRKTASSKR